MPPVRSTRCAASPCSMHMVRHGSRRAAAWIAHTASSADSRLPSSQFDAAEPDGAAERQKSNRSRRRGQLQRRMPQSPASVARETPHATN